MSVKQTLLDFNITLPVPFDEKSMMNLKEKITEELQDKFGNADLISQPKPNTLLMLFFFDTTDT